VNAVFVSANDSTAGAAPIKSVLAANLRRLRIARELSLSELARAMSVGKATLSAIENGQANPTVDTLSLLAAALRVPIAELLEEPPLGEVRVVRAGPAARAAVTEFGERAIERFDAAGPVRVSELALPARHVHEADPGPAGSREELFVLQGTLIAGPVERITQLSAGDYASFPADAPRQYETGRHAARALLLSHGDR
jgi:transcriptional regulator with XRE-family HTH domain